MIPYIGDLLDTALVSSLDVRGQRLDVANTIHYRRRKGTVEVLEELASAITGHTAHVVEGFRLLARSRHGLDPAAGPGAYPGGYLDLRNAHAATLVDTPFDEAFHQLDVRATAPFAIDKLLVFLWRLQSFTVAASTPVPVPGCAGLAYGADPTGRQIPLFLPAPPVPDDFAGTWTSAGEWDVPGPLTTSLVDLMVSAGANPAFALAGASLAALHPEIGRFATTASPASALTISYNYAGASTIGAGPYDRTQFADPPVTVAPVQPAVTGGGSALQTALVTAPATGTVVVGDSLTYTSLAAVGSSVEPIGAVVCQAGAEQRPVLRVPAASGPWVLTGAPGATLVLDGLLLSGVDLVLRGAFASVRITGCTLDPGTAATAAAAGAPPVATAIDGVGLSPTRVFIEGDPGATGATNSGVQSLTIDHCVLGPVRTRYGGAIETLTISDSIVQAIPTTTGSAYTAADVYDPVLLARGLMTAADPLAAAIAAQLPAAAKTALTTLAGETLSAAEAPLDPAILTGLNALVAHTTALYDPAAYPSVTCDPQTASLAATAIAGTLDATDLALLNRRLLDAAFPVALGLAALAIADAEVTLQRVTVIGPAAVHRLTAADSILGGGLTVVDDVQTGCVRYSAVTAASRLPRQYRCAELNADASILRSADYGDPAYGQLIDGVDAAIVGGATGASIAAGGENGSEMGALASELEPVNEAALALKLAEYMPIGLTPVVVHVT